MRCDVNSLSDGDIQYRETFLGEISLVFGKLIFEKVVTETLEDMDISGDLVLAITHT